MVSCDIIVILSQTAIFKVKCPILGQNEKFDLYLDNGNELLLLIDIRRYDHNVGLFAFLTVIIIYCHRNPFN